MSVPSENILNHFETSSLPSVFLDPATTDDYVHPDERSLVDHERAEYIEDASTSRSLVHDVPRRHRRGPHSRGQSKRPPKKRRRIHSDTDLRKMRPFIISPFMRPFSTHAQVPTISQSEARRRPTIHSVGYMPPMPLPSYPIPIATGTSSSVRRLAGQNQEAKYGTIPLKGPIQRMEEEDKTIIELPSEDEEESDEESTEESSDESSYIKFSDLTKKQKASIFILAMTNFLSTVAFSCIAPFYPGEAEMKGMNTTEIGLVFGIFELVMFVTAPLIGNYMHIFGSKRMFSIGIFVTGITAIAFGFLNLLPAGSAFFWASLLIRCTEALGDACFVTSSFVIGAKSFPGRIATIVGIMETSAGLGYTAGPVLGGFLYELGGFQMPFFVLGMFLVIVTGISYQLVEEIEDDSSDDAMGMLSMLKIPVIWLMVFAVISCAVSLSFFDPTLAGHLASFHLSTTMVGMMFLLCGGFYLITAPLWGLLLDSWHKCSNTLMLFGSISTIFAMIFIGPSPLVTSFVQKDLYLIGLSLSVLGVAAGALYIPIFQSCLDAVKENGYDDSFHTYGCVAGVFQSAWALGAFIGPTLGGLGVETIGFPYTTTIIAGINTIFASVLTLHFIISYIWKGSSKNEKE